MLKTHLAAINYKESTLATKFRQYNITALSGYIDPIANFKQHY
jgi:hypothetical protein